MIIEHETGLLLIRNDLLGERNWRNDDCYKFIFSPYGKGIYQIPQRDLSMNTGHFLIFNPDQEHKQIHVTREKFLVEMDYDFLKNIANQLGFNRIEPEFASISYKNPQLLNWVTFIRAYLNEESSDEMKELFIDNSLIQLAILMLQYGPGSHQDGLPTSSDAGALDNVIDTLKQNYEEAWTLDDMSVQAGINKYQFAHLFKETTGLSPYSWLQLFRLIKSQQLLIQTNDSILSIALKVGFKNISSYNHLFKKIYRKTPTEFRWFYRKNN